MRHLVSLLAITAALAGCTAGVGPLDKDGEDAAPLDGKADGFRNPTEHGQLRFGVASRAYIGDAERFHSWVFAVSGTSQVAIEVKSSDRNLDTVMYLYHRESEDERWGRYIARNDDHGDSMQSKITRELEAGLYRVIVKGYKTHHSGPLSLEALCEGRGCAEPGTDPVNVPPETGFTHACVDKLWESVGSAIVSTQSFGIHPETRTGHDRAVLVATAHYDGVSDWDEYVDGDERDEFTFDVAYTQLENGFLVQMADGGDESTTDYAFDQAGNLLAYYVHNQSPWTGFYCGEAGDESRPEPPEDCVSAWMSNGPRRGAVTNGIETYSSELPNDEIDDLMKAAIARYQSEALDGDDTAEIRIEYSSWESDEGRGSDLLLSSGDAEMVSYTVVDGNWGDPWIVFESSDNDDEGPHMTCARSAAD